MFGTLMMRAFRDEWVKIAQIQWAKLAEGQPLPPSFVAKMKADASKAVTNPNMRMGISELKAKLNNPKTRQMIAGFL